MESALNDIEKNHLSKPNSIVLMTDGANNAGISMETFIEQYKKVSAKSEYPIRIFVIGYAEADEKELKKLTTISNGKYFDSKKNSLSKIFKEVRNYQ